MRDWWGGRKLTRMTGLILAILMSFALSVGPVAQVRLARASPSFTFSTIDVPGASQTFAYGVNNNGQIVGQYTDSGGKTHGYLLSGGSFTTIDAPGALSYTAAFGINSNGQIVGTYDIAGVPTLGFFRDTGGSFTAIRYSNTQNTQLFGINDTGMIVGTCETANPPNAACPTFLGVAPGFILSGVGGTFTFVCASSLGALSVFSCGTNAIGINNAGTVVGGYETLACSAAPIFGYRVAGGVGGTYTQIVPPSPCGVSGSEAHGINNLGQIVGFALNPAEHGFFFDPSGGGSYTMFDVTGATITDARAINDSGQIVGNYLDASNHWHGFTTAVAFANFKAKVDINLASSSFDVNSTFTLGSGGSIDPPNQAMTFQLGGFSITIPAGSFHLVGKGKHFVFDGTVNGVALSANLTPLGGNSYSFKLEGAGASNLPTSNPVTLGLTIGRNVGSVKVNAGGLAGGTLTGTITGSFDSNNILGASIVLSNGVTGTIHGAAPGTPGSLTLSNGITAVLTQNVSNGPITFTFSNGLTGTATNIIGTSGSGTLTLSNGVQASFTLVNGGTGTVTITSGVGGTFVPFTP